MSQSANQLLHIIAQAIYDKKGFNILALDVQGVCTMTDHFIIAEGTVDRHVKALANTIIDKLKEYNMHPMHAEGMQEGDWIVLDYVDFVIHLFIPELRDKYALEQVWSNGEIVDLEIKLDKEAPKRGES